MYVGVRRGALRCLSSLSLWLLTTHISSHSRVGVPGYLSTWRPGIGGVAGVQGALVAYSYVRHDRCGKTIGYRRFFVRFMNLRGGGIKPMGKLDLATIQPADELHIVIAGHAEGRA